MFDEEPIKPIKGFEPDTNFQQMDYLKQFLASDRKKSEFSSFVKKLKKQK